MTPVEIERTKVVDVDCCDPDWPVTVTARVRTRADRTSCSSCTVRAESEGVRTKQWVRRPSPHPEERVDGERVRSVAVMAGRTHELGGVKSKPESQVRHCVGEVVHVWQGAVHAAHFWTPAEV